MIPGDDSLRFLYLDDLCLLLFSCECAPVFTLALSDRESIQLSSMDYQRASTPELEPYKSDYDYPRTMLVVDPISRKLNVPLECISETLARFRQGTPSLCMLNLNGRCRQGANCHQVHADPQVVFALRAQAQQSLMCCMTHGDRATMQREWQERYYIQFSGGSGVTIPINRLAVTQGLLRYIDDFEQSNGVPEDPEQQVCLAPSVTTICRLHGQDRCRFSEDCKFLHLCKELLWSEISAAGISPSHSSGRRYSSPSTPHYADMPPSPPMTSHGYLGQRGAYQMSCESLISMDLTATPPMTPTSPMNSPVIKCKAAGDSWSYEPYGFNPVPMMPPALEASE